MKFVMFRVNQVTDQYVVAPVLHEDAMVIVLDNPMLMDFYTQGGEPRVSSCRWAPMTADGTIEVNKMALLGLMVPHNDIIAYYNKLNEGNSSDKKLDFIRGRLQDIEAWDMERRANAPYTTAQSS